MKETKTEKTIIDDVEMESVPELTDSYETSIQGLASISKAVKTSCINMSKEQLKALVDAYYQAQDDRCTKANQLKAFKQQFDVESETVKGDKSITALEWLYKDAYNREAQIKKMLTEYAENQDVCSWAMGIVGIGPIFAVALYAYLDMDKCPTASSFCSYAGLNDQNNPWLGKEKAKKLVDEVYKELGYKNSDPADERVIVRIASKCGRTPENIKRHLEKTKQSSSKKITDYTALCTHLAKPPYNQKLKTIVYNIGKLGILMKNKNPNSLYGRLYREKRAELEMKNENGYFAERAAKMLQEKQYKKGTVTYKALSQGKLSNEHITRMALRHAVSKILHHYWECTYRFTYHKLPDPPYPIAHMGHKDYLEPEVPFPDFF